MDALIVEWMLTADGGRPDNTYEGRPHRSSLSRELRLVRLRARRCCRRSDRDMHAHEMWKTLRVPRDTRQMCRTQAYKHLFMPTGRVPGVRGRARTRPGWVRSPFSTSIALYPILAVNLYADVIKFAHLQHQASFHDLVAPVVRLTTTTHHGSFPGSSLEITTGTNPKFIPT